MSDPTHPIRPLPAVSPEVFRARIPGSKSYTNRALLLAAQRVGKTRVRAALHCDDTRHLGRCLDAFAGLTVTETPTGFDVVRSARELGAPAEPLFVGAAGTPARFLLSFASSVQGGAVVTGTKRLCERPMGDLLEALAALGIRTECEALPGCLPVRVHAGTPQGNHWRIHGGVSSQFVSSLILLAAQQEQGPIAIEATGHLVSRPYVLMTLRMLNDCGIKAEAAGQNLFVVHPAEPVSEEIAVEVDASAMSYFLVAAAITRSRVRIDGIARDSAQGDVGLVGALEAMGCKVAWDRAGVTITGGELSGIEIDMEEMPDTVLSLAIAAALAKGETRITNIANLRVKECDRIHAAATELAHLGIDAEQGDDFLVIRGGALRPGFVHTYDDHRVAMAFGLLRLVQPGIEIEDPACVAKSFPGFWQELERFCAHHAA